MTSSHELYYLYPPLDTYDCTCCNQVYTPCCITEAPAGVCLGCTELIDPNDLICPMCIEGNCVDCHGFWDIEE